MLRARLRGFHGLLGNRFLGLLGRFLTRRIAGELRLAHRAQLVDPRRGMFAHWKHSG